MKKLTIVMILIIITSNLFGQSNLMSVKSTQTPIKIQSYVPYKTESSLPVGPSMMIGGLTFMAAGLLTQPRNGGLDEMTKIPLYKQGPRFITILSGGVVFTTGLFISF
jgi:hypothetical protein